MLKRIPKKKRSLAKAPEQRLTDIFPSRFDLSQSSSSGSYWPSNPERLYSSLLNTYAPERHVEHIVVTAAWYGKQKRSARHEFILLEVEDDLTKGLINYIVLDRVNAQAAQVCSGVTAFSHTEAQAADAFKVAFDGDRSRLIRECSLNNHWLMEELRFSPEQPLYLYEVVVLARKVSQKYPHYHPVISNCYLFAGLVWECMREMRPRASYYCEPGFEEDRGKFIRVRYRPELAKVKEIHQEVTEEIQKAQGKLEEQIAAHAPTGLNPLPLPQVKYTLGEGKWPINLGRGSKLPWFFCGTGAVDLGDSPATGTREQMECEGTTWHTQSSSLQLISCQPTSYLEMTMVPMEQEREPERIRGGGCCNWGPSTPPKHADDHPGLQIGQARPVAPRQANGKQSSLGGPNPATPKTKQQQNARAATVPAPSNSKAAKPPKPPKAPKAPKPPKAPKSSKPAKAPPPPARAASTPAQAPVKPVQGPSNPRKPSLKSPQTPLSPSPMPAESSHPIFPNLPSQLPERR